MNRWERFHSAAYAERGSERHWGHFLLSSTSTLVFTYNFINFSKVEESAFWHPTHMWNLQGAEDAVTQKMLWHSSLQQSHRFLIEKHESGYTCPLNLTLLIYRAALCDDVTTGGFDRVQSKDDCTSNSAVHRVIPSHVSRIRALDI